MAMLPSGCEPWTFCRVLIVLPSEQMSALLEERRLSNGYDLVTET